MIKNPDSLTQWQEEIMSWAESKGWNQNLNERSFGDWIALFHTELSEAYEDYRNHHDLNEIYYEDGATSRKYAPSEVVEIRRIQLESGDIQTDFKPCGIPIEIADLIIRILHFAQTYNFSLAAMITEKMAYNEKRSYRHGNKKV